jgi:O-acetyl-ADP-ribose deacetylase (regulator of RNase III)
MTFRIGNTEIEITQGDLTLQDVDVIVNAANNDLLLGGGVAGAIARRGGPSIQAECRRIGPIRVGEAAVTGGGDLRAHWVIHAASMELGGRTTAEALASSTRRSLEIANSKQLGSMALPAVGTGIARFPVDECARIMLEEVVDHCRRGTSLREIRFVLFGAETESAFNAEAGRLLDSAEKTRKEGRSQEGEGHDRQKNKNRS